MTAPLRPLTHLHMLAEAFPAVWRQTEQMRQQRGLTLPTWPAHVYLPLAAAAAIVTQGAPDPPADLLIGPAIGIIGALTSWRATQGLYQVDPDIFEALWTTPLSGELPTALLHHLPEWCVYVPCPTPRPWGPGGHLGQMHGWYFHLEWDTHTHEEEARFLLDLETPSGLALLPFALHLGEWGLEVAAQRSLAVSLANYQQAGETGEAQALQEQMQDAAALMGTLLTPLLSVVLYLCSEASELHDAAGKRDKPAYAQPVKTKRGPRLFPPDQPTTWEVAFRLGAALRAGQARGAQEETGEPGEGRARPRAHIRRAHFHTFWTGKGRTVPRVHWLHPLLVAAEEPDGLVPTVHPVG